MLLQEKTMDQAVMKIIQIQSNIQSLHLHRDPLWDTCRQSSFGRP